MEQPVARLIIRRAREMTKEQRKELAGWLREQARGLTKDGRDYAKLFTAKFCGFGKS